MTRKALDSAYPPSDAQIAAAKAAGYIAWFGYFKFGNDGVLNGWTDADFKRVLAGGLNTMAYCSGYAPPLAAGARADALLIPLCLDDESGMRPDGPWVQSWLDASGGGLYGNYWVFPGRHAAFYVLAAYPTSGDPSNVSWWSASPRPAGLCAWQWCGSHPEFGITVDDTWMDDGLFTFGAATNSLGGMDMAIADDILAAVRGLALPPRPASVAAYTDAQLLNMVATMTWAAIEAKIGKDGEAYAYALSHPVSVFQTVATLTEAVKKLAAATGTPIDLSKIAADIAAVKAEEDAIKAAVDAIKAKTDKDLA